MDSRLSKKKSSQRFFSIKSYFYLKLHKITKKPSDCCESLICRFYWINQIWCCWIFRFFLNDRRFFSGSNKRGIEVWNISFLVLLLINIFFKKMMMPGYQCQQFDILIFCKIDKRTANILWFWKYIFNVYGFEFVDKFSRPIGKQIWKAMNIEDAH